MFSHAVLTVDILVTMYDIEHFEQDAYEAFEAFVAFVERR
jgi:hypothetical protein